MMDESRKDEFGILAKYFNTSTKKLRDHEEKLRQLAYYDQLTNLPNRFNFLSYIERMLKRTKWKSDYLFAVLFIDLDNFKIINDSLGHIIGDKFLIGVARRLETCTRPTDRVSRVAGNDTLARFGGDEFALFLNDIKDISSASRVADRIQKALQKTFNIDGHELFTSASIGIAISASGYENAEDILRDADSAMYRAKVTGKAHAEIFDEAMHVSVTEILQLESDLRTAVEEEQFMVYYQPIVSAKDSRITGAEALIRWNHPQQGFISPLDFIPIAEETGLISTIGEWVLRTACTQNKAWQDAGHPNLLMKVNFSSRQFKDDNLVKLVKEIISDIDIPAQLLDVEITESIAMDKSSFRILNQLTSMGLKTSIDDFGTGYSSLGSLTQFPINTIKIDRSFVEDIMVDVRAKAIIKAIIAMAHSLDIEVVAEGVETEEQLAYLQSHKCDKIQGYLFSRPVPEEDFRKLLEQDKFSTFQINKHSVSKV
jgi:diguanylate cyclase (GGDEF)-like protein